jgi:PST family polysaccharide transporter
MEQQALRGVPWTLLAYAATKLVTVASTLVLAHLLAPADFGLVALAWLALGLVAVLRDLGLSATLVLRQDLERPEQGTVLTLMLLLAAATAAVVAACAPLVAAVFGEPRLSGVVAGLAATLAVGGMTGFYEALLQRELAFRPRFVSQVAQAAAYAAIAIGLAAAGAGVWSLVAGQLAGTVLYGAVLLAMAPYRVRPAYDRAVARDVMGTSRGFLGQAALAFVQQNADYFAVGRILGAAPVGFYSMAYRLAELPYAGIADPIAKVTFPGFARMRGRGEAVAPAFLSVLRLVAVVTCPLGVLLSACAEPFTVAVLGERWLPMIGPVAVLGLWGAVRTVQVTIAWLLNSVGEAGLMATISAVVLLPLIPGLLVAADLGGITAVAWAMLADMTLSLVLLAVFAARRAGVGLGAQWRAVRPVLVACPAAWLAARGLVATMDGDSPWLVLAASALAGLVVYAAVATLAERRLLADSVRQAARALGRGGERAAQDARSDSAAPVRP